MPVICTPGDDGNYGSTAVQDVVCLQTISTRIYYGDLPAPRHPLRVPPPLHTTPLCSDPPRSPPPSPIRSVAIPPPPVTSVGAGAGLFVAESKFRADRERFTAMVKDPRSVHESCNSLTSLSDIMGASWHIVGLFRSRPRTKPV